MDNVEEMVIKYPGRCSCEHNDTSRPNKIGYDDNYYVATIGQFVDYDISLVPEGGLLICIYIRLYEMLMLSRFRY